MNFFPTGQTKFCFLFGNLVTENSPSPSFHSKKFFEKKLNCIYLSYPLETEFEFINSVENLMKTQNFIGGNITHPFKKAALKINNIVLSEDVENTESANTISRMPDGSFCLFNTDLFGIQSSFVTLGLKRKSYHGIIFGDGGTSNSVKHAMILDKKCLSITIVSRNTFTQRKGSKILILNHKDFNLYPFISKNSCYLIVNTIPIDTDENRGPKLLWEKISKGGSGLSGYFFDLIYRDTYLVKYFKGQNVACLNGEHMFQIQADRSFEYWEKYLNNI